jgi:hypothetical protein
MLVRIKDNPTLVRDVTNRALLNTDVEGLNNYKTQRLLAKKRLQEQEEMKNKVEKLEQDISEIKNLLQQLVTRT